MTPPVASAHAPSSLHAGAEPGLRLWPSRVAACGAGRGLVASVELAPGAAVERFTGPVLGRAHIPPAEVAYALWLGEDEWLLPQSAARFINHGCDPNCEIVDDLTVVTTRAVAAGEELTFAYNLADPEEALADPAAFAWDPRWSFACRCGARGCMGRIDGYRLRARRRPVAAFLADGRAGAALRIGGAGARGRGVFSTSAITQGELVERAPVIVVPAAEWPQVAASEFYHYCFAFGPGDRDAALALGHGSLFNHDWQPNAVYRKRPELAAIDFIARRAIAPGEEICINYNGDPDDRTPLWFAVAP
jgi:hypothetical protein